MPPTEHEALVRRVFHEGSSQPNPPSVLQELFAPDFVCHGPPGMQHDHDGGARGPETCIFNDAFADLGFTVEKTNVEGDRVVAGFTARGRHIAEFQGVPPTGNEVTINGVVSFRIERDKIAEAWGSLRWG